MTTTQKRRPPEQGDGAQNIINHGNFILPTSGIVNPKRAERLARRLRRAEARLDRLTVERERLVGALAGLGGEGHAG